MKPCGKYSLTEGVRAIAIGDLLFSIFSILLHIVEGSKATLADEMKDLDSENKRYLVITASSLLSWIYFGLSCVNAFLAILLLVGVSSKNSVQLAAYMLIWVMSLLFGISICIFQIANLGQSPFYFGLVAYPCFYVYKFYSLWVVKCLINEIKNESTVKIPLLIKRNVKSSRKRKKSSNRQQKKYVDIRASTLAHLKDNSYQIDGEKLHIDFGNLIEYDENTAVMKGELRMDKGVFNVAIRTTKSNANYQTNHNLLLEMKLFDLLDAHENVIQFIGACCDHSSHVGKIFFVTEFYPSTKLDRFLIESQDEYYGSFINQIKNDTIIAIAQKRKLYENVAMLRENFSTTSLVDWSYQIADGMEYLHTKKIVHGSLCAKNIILFDNGTCKISGFRFAAQLYNNKYNRSNLVDITGCYPWRWMSIECIESTDENNFTEKSDVWSYGITLWEMFSLGECPYANWNADFVQELMAGARLQNPRFATTEIYKIMTTCWHSEIGERPTFYLLKLFFQQLANSIYHQLQH